MKNFIVQTSENSTVKPLNLPAIAVGKAACGLDDLVTGMKRTGLRPGDIVFFQVSHLSLDPLEFGSRPKASSEVLYSAMREVIGPEGTMLLPAFSLSFCKNEDFDLETTPSIEGAWSSSLEFLEYFRRLPGVVRSADPIYSVAGLGPRAEELLTRLPNTSYGKDCLYERLVKSGGKICGIGVGLAEAPFLHYVEEAVGVPFRYKKLFTGRIGQNGKVSKRMDFERADPVPKWSSGWNSSGKDSSIRGPVPCRRCRAGRSCLYRLQEFLRTDKREIAQDPWITARGPAGDPVELENARTGGKDNRHSTFRRMHPWRS